jgi:hypothetical protein
MNHPYTFAFFPFDGRNKKFIGRTPESLNERPLSGCACGPAPTGMGAKQTFVQLSAIGGKLDRQR